MMLKKGMQIATRTMAKGQKGAGLSGIFVIPKTEVTNVRGYSIRVSRIYTRRLSSRLLTYHEKEVDNSQDLDVVPLVHGDICQFDRLA